MLNGPFFSPRNCTSNWFTSPTFGSSSRIQPRVTDRAGRKNANQNMNSSPRAHGMFVLASSQAMTTPIGKEMIWYQKATTSEFHNAENRPDVCHASTQACNLYAGGCPMRAV